MSGSKIDALNRSVEDMISALKNDREFLFNMAVITFGEGSGPRIYQPYTNVQQMQWHPLSAQNDTPLGRALQIAKAMIEDKKVTPSRSLRPTVVLISDGQPNDSWQQPLDAFINEGRSQKCDRWAMAIGSDADEAMLRQFAKPGQNPDRFFQGNAGDIHQFFQKVTMSVSMYTRSTISSPKPFGGAGGSSVKGRNDDDDVV
jgi:uncharacterized protein YegL